MDRPAPPASKTLEDVQTWSEGPFSTWVERKMKALKSAENQLESLTAASDAERIVAAGLVAIMYDQFVAHFTDAPIPDKIRDDPELRAIYIGALLDHTEPLVEHARQTYAVCGKIPGNAQAQWRALCARRREAMDRRRAEARQRIERDRQAGPGPGSRRASPDPAPEPPPGGPDVCWDNEGAWASPKPDRPVAERVLLLPYGLQRVNSGDAPLLDRERTALMRAVHARVDDLVELEVAPWRETRRYVGAWRAGRSRPGGPRCQRPRASIPADELVGNVLPSCDEGSCNLRVQFVSHDVRRPEGAPRLLQAVVQGDPVSADAWMAAARALSPSGESGHGHVIGTLRGLSVHDRPYVAVADPRVRAYGDWQDRDEAERTVREAKDALAQCLRHEPHPVDHYGYVLAIDSRGRVSHLFSGRDRPQDSRTMHRCVDRTIRQLRFPGDASGERRAVVVLQFDLAPRTRRDRYGRLDHATGVRVQFPRLHSASGLNPLAVIETTRVRAALAACYADAYEEDPPTTAHRIRLAVDARGRTSSVELEWLGEGTGGREMSELERCLTGALRDTAWSCPRGDDEAEVEGVVCLYRESGSVEPDSESREADGASASRKTRD